jgi:translation elongation factor EF-4
MEIIQERLEREYNLDLIITAPSVVYKVSRDGEMQLVENPSRLPDPGEDRSIEEPFFKVTIHVPSDYVGAVMQALPGAPRRAEGHPVRVAPTA